MDDLYVPQSGKYYPDRPVDLSRCRVQVYEPVSRNFSQCSRKKTVEVDGVGYCKQHNPEAQAARTRAATAKWEADCRRGAMGTYGERWLTALAKIRDGDNDPRETARLALEGCKYEPRHVSPPQLSEDGL